MIEILGASNQALDLVGAEHDRQAMPLLRIRQVLTPVASFQDVPAKEPQRADLGDHRPDGQARVRFASMLRSAASGGVYAMLPSPRKTAPVIFPSTAGSMYTVPVSVNVAASLVRTMLVTL